MGELIRPTKVNIITKDGECELHIIVDLNINLNTNGVNVKQENIPEEKEETTWAIPTFNSQNKIKFGKKEE